MEFGLSALREQVPPIPQTRPSAPSRPTGVNREINQFVAVDTTLPPVEPPSGQQSSIRVDAQGNRVNPGPPVPKVRPSINPPVGGTIRNMLGLGPKN